MQFSEITYPATLTEDETGATIVSFRDVPEALTGDDDRAIAKTEAEDCLLAALEIYMRQRRPIPTPSAVGPEDLPVRVPPLARAKLALYEILIEQSLSNSELGRRVNLSESQVRRLLDLRHETAIDRIDAYLRLLGQRLVVTIEAAE